MFNVKGEVSKVRASAPQMWKGPEKDFISNGNKQTQIKTPRVTSDSQMKNNAASNS